MQLTDKMQVEIAQIASNKYGIFSGYLDAMYVKIFEKIIHVNSRKKFHTDDLFYRINVSIDAVFFAAFLTKDQIARRSP